MIRSPAFRTKNAMPFRASGIPMRNARAVTARSRKPARRGRVQISPTTIAEDWLITPPQA